MAGARETATAIDAAAAVRPGTVLAGEGSRLGGRLLQPRSGG